MQETGLAIRVQDPWCHGRHGPRALYAGLCRLGVQKEMGLGPGHFGEYVRVGIYLVKVVNGSAPASHNLCIIDLHPIKDESTGVEGLYAIDYIGV